MSARSKARGDHSGKCIKVAADVKVKKSSNPAVEDDEDDWQEVPNKRLRFVDVLSEIPNGDASNATDLCLPDRGFTDIESLESCRSLKKLELKNNYVTELAFLDMNHELCWLGLAKNRLQRIDGLSNLSSLAVLDLSDNRIARLEGLAGLVGLKALIAVRNRISKVEGLSPKKNPVLETLVLSHNQISECNLPPFPALKKISLAHNKLHVFPGLAMQTQLSELRLNGNRIPALSVDVARQPNLSILDVGNNLLQSGDKLEPLRGLLWIKSFNLLGNSLADDVEKEPLKSILASLPKLEILNNRRLPQAGEKSVKRKGRGRRKSKGWDDKSSGGTSTWHKYSDQNWHKDVDPVAVHGRGFQGKRSVFEDETLDDNRIAGASKNGTRTIVKGTKKKKMKRAVESEGIAAKTKAKKRKAGVDTSTQGVAGTSDGASKNVAPKKRKKKIAKKVL